MTSHIRMMRVIFRTKHPKLGVGAPRKMYVDIPCVGAPEKTHEYLDARHAGTVARNFVLAKLRVRGLSADIFGVQSFTVRYRGEWWYADGNGRFVA